MKMRQTIYDRGCLKLSWNPPASSFVVWMPAAFPKLSGSQSFVALRLWLAAYFRSVSRSRHCARDVWGTVVYRFTASSRRRRPIFQRVHRHVRVACCDLGLCQISILCGAICGGRLHHFRLLVYGLTSFANPAVTLARSATNTFAGIRPLDVPAFIAAQLAGSAVATFLFRWLAPTPPQETTSETAP